MSLINKMLQDLDARGGAADVGAMPASSAVKAVPVAERERRPLVVAVGGMMLVLLAVGGWYGWQYWQYSRNHDFTAAPVPQVVVEPAAPAAAVASGASVPPGVSVTPGAAIPPGISVTPAAPVPPAAPVAPAVSPAPAPLKAKPTESQSGPLADHKDRVRSSSAVASPVSSDAHRPLPATDAQAASPPRRALPDREARAAERKPATSEGVVRRELTPKVESDSAYRRALVALQEGRVSVAMADLERAVEIDPRNESARQTYVSLLLESKRTDEAIRQLRLSLGVDPRQPALAMVLARLQLERGGPALATLMKTLPHAANNADYLAFLAGVLQREQRHADAARYYRDALQIAPNNGVWWMGLGISLQAGQHLPEAREAYTRARASAGMTAELLAFIDRKLEQLAR